MIARPLLVLLLLVGAGAAQNPTFELRQRSDVGPLTLKSIDSDHFWLSVTWDPKTPPEGRRVNGKVPDERFLLAFLSIQLDYIGPRPSREPAERERFKQLFVEGVQKLLKQNRAFWFEVTETSYAGPGQIGGVLLLDEWGSTTIQSEMIRYGYAITRSRHSWNMVEKYGDDFRDKLLRLEGEARASRSGVWRDEKA